jgi:hypothetical protein
MTGPTQASESATAPSSVNREAALAHRLELIERDNRRMRRLGTAMLIGIGVILGLCIAVVVVAARHGMPGFVPAVTESSKFLLRDGDGRIRGTWGMNGDGSVLLALQDSGGRDRLRLSVLPDGSAGLAFVDSARQSRVVLGLLPDQSSSLVLADGGGKTRTVLGLSPSGASTILFADRGGTARAGLGVDTRGVGTFTLLDRSGGDLTSNQDSQVQSEPADTPLASPQAPPKRR